MRVIGSGHVYDAAAGPRHGRVCAHTTISLLHDGTVLVAFRRGSARDSLDGHVCVYASTDQARPGSSATTALVSVRGTVLRARSSASRLRS